MTDAHPAANDQTPRAELTPRDLPSPSEMHEFHETADRGGAPDVVTPVTAGSGSANAGDAYPGVVPPADWFQAPEEAAPSGQPFMEPVCPENQASGAVVPAGSQDDGPVADYPASDDIEYDYLKPTQYPEENWQPAQHWEPAAEWEPAGERESAPEPEPAGGRESAAETEPTGGRQPAGGQEQAGEREVEPVVGPTEARWGRPGGPGFMVPQGVRYGLYDPEGRSGWQLSHDLWQDSGIVWETPEGLQPDDASLPWRLAAPTAQSYVRDEPAPGSPTSSDVQLTPMLQPMTRPQPVAEEQSPPGAVPPGAVPPEGLPAESTRPENVLSETAPPLGAPTASDTLPRREARPTRPEYRQPALPSRTAPQAPMSPRMPVPRAQPPRVPLPRVPQPQVQPPQARPPRGPLSQGATQPQPQAQRSVPQQQMPWEEPRPAPQARRGGRGRGHWQAARVGVPIVVILAVGAGALALLTGKAHEALQSTGSLGAAGPGGNNPTTFTSGTAARASTAGGGSLASVAFPGYPGLRGSVQVTSLASDGTVQVAVGGADGHAALWRRDGTGTWTLLRDRPGLQQNVILTSIAHGPDGWLAVGNVSSAGQPSTATVGSTGQAPVVLTSTDGVTWTSAVGNAVFAGPGFTVNAVAADASGYVIVGEQIVHNVPTDAMWFTPNLASWTRGGDTIASTVSSLSSGMSDSKIFAVAATATGFVAVGTHNGCHTAWVTSDGQHWKSYDIPKPTGTQDPLLSHVAVSGDTVVATGDLGVGAGRIPLIVVSKDGGVSWQSTPIGNYGAFSGPQGTVTAITSDASGFIAAGLVGAPGRQQAVTWTSPDGITWSQATPAAGGTQSITALAPGGRSVSSIATVMAKFGTQAVEVTP